MPGKGTGSESSRCLSHAWKGDWLRVLEVPVPFPGSLLFPGAAADGHAQPGGV
jgi:hypothetical protein